jgi:hypothetical protein
MPEYAKMSRPWPQFSGKRDVQGCHKRQQGMDRGWCTVLWRCEGALGLSPDRRRLQDTRKERRRRTSKQSVMHTARRTDYTASLARLARALPARQIARCKKQWMPSTLGIRNCTVNKSYAASHSKLAAAFVDPVCQGGMAVVGSTSRELPSLCQSRGLQAQKACDRDSRFSSTRNHRESDLP